MNSSSIIRHSAVVISSFPRLTRSVRTSLAVGLAKAGRLAFLILPSAFFLLSPARGAAPAELPVVNHYVYLSFLPKASELVQDAKINGLTILRIDELPDRVIVSYQYPDGQTATLGYALLGSKPASNAQRYPEPVEGTAGSATPAATERHVVREPEVVYVERSPRVVYYNDPYYYNYWAPLTVGFGLGWATSYYGGHYYYHGGGHYHGHGGHGGGHHGGGHGGHGGHGHGHR